MKVAVFDPVLFVSLNNSRNRVKILYWERNGFFLCPPYVALVVVCSGLMKSMVTPIFAMLING